MKRLSLFLAVSLMFLVSVPAVAVGAFHYESKALGISITAVSYTHLRAHET